jgi:hypothetical protein
MSGITIECPVHFRKARAGQKKLKAGESPQSVPEGSIPRVSRLMALAIRFDGLIRAGRVRDYAELARGSGNSVKRPWCRSPSRDFRRNCFVSGAPIISRSGFSEPAHTRHVY